MFRGGSIDEQRSDAQRSEIVDGEPEHRQENRWIAVLRTGCQGVAPTAHRWFVVPAQAFPAKNAESSNDPDRAGWVPLNDRRVEHVRKHRNVALRAGGSVENDQLVPAVIAA